MVNRQIQESKELNTLDQGEKAMCKRFIKIVAFLAVLSVASLFNLPTCHANQYEINYRYNAAGRYGDPNPYYGNRIPPGPHFIDAAPGHYRITVLEVGPGGWANSHVGWSGDSGSGTLIGIPTEVGQSTTFEHTFGQIVLYAYDWYPWDNPPENWTKVSLDAANLLPIANAGENLNIPTQSLSSTTITGSAQDPDQNDVLQYRWLEGETVLKDWSPVESGTCPLDLAGLDIPIGTHILTLEVTDGKATCEDEMILSIENSSPHCAPSGAGTYQINTPVELGGSVSDFDGDELFYQWLEGADVIASGSVSTTPGGDPVSLPSYSLSSLGLGLHTLALHVSDGINAPASVTITVEIIDDIKPTLAPVADRTILWPPNHEMVSIHIAPNACDNSGLPVNISVSIQSNEPDDGLGDGDLAPDWTAPVIDAQTGLITVDLRAERSGSGSGREYTVTLTATDAAGNSSSADVLIIVPHDQKKK